MATMSQSVKSRTVNTSPFYGMQLRKFTLRALATLGVFLFLFVYLSPIGSMFLVSISDQETLSIAQTDPIYPQRHSTFTYQGEELKLYEVPFESGTKVMAAIQLRRETAKDPSLLIDPANPGAGPVEWRGNFQKLFTPVK